MTVHEIIGAAGEWSVTLAEETPDEVLKALGLFGHVAILHGRVDVDADSPSLLKKARYVGVLRKTGRADDRTIGGPGMVTWLGDEDEKGAVIENKITITSQTIAASVAAILPPAVTVGTIYTLSNPALRYTGSFQYVTPRTALKAICDFFAVEFRVNGDGTVDVGRQDQLYAAVPDTIIVRKGAGTDLDLTALGGSFTTQIEGQDYTTRALLLGTKIGSGTTPDSTFVTGSADAGSIPYLDIHGNPVKLTRMISESSTDLPATATARAQLFLNEFNRLKTSLSVTAEDYHISGDTFACGDNTFVYDPDNGIVNAAYERDFRGQNLHPDIVRISEVTWPISAGYTVAYRSVTGTWFDLTRYVVPDAGSTTNLVVGDLPKQLTDAGKYTVGDRVDAGLVDKIAPKTPTGLALTTNSTITPKGTNAALISATWTAPTQNADGTPLIDLAYYFVRYRVNTVGQWQSAATLDTNIDLPVALALSYEVQVAAVDTSNNSSAFTASQTITSAADSVAPNPPADPVVTNYLGQLRIEYAGTDSTGNPMATDTNRVDVYVDTTSGFTPTAANRVSSLNPFAKGVAYATAPYALVNNRWVRLVAYDHSGNASAPSASIGGHTQWVATGDIANLAVTDALIANLSVGKLTAGTMSADVVTSGRFTTALTGARREMNAVGFQAFDASNNMLVNIDGVNNLLTGILKTALTGRRIEMGVSGTQGIINFFDGTGSLFAYMAGVQLLGGEGLMLNVASSANSAWWNAFRIDTGELAFLNAKNVHIGVGGTPGGTGDFRVSFAVNRGSSSAAPVLDDRLVISEKTVFNTFRSDGNFVVNEEDATTGVLTTRLNINDTEYDFGWTGTNRRIAFSLVPSTASGAGFVSINGNNFGGLLKYHYPGTGSERFEAREWNDAYAIELWASAFTVVSAEDTKDNVKPWAGDPLAALSPVKPVTFQRKRGPDTKGKPLPTSPTEVGVLAGQMPTEVQAIGDDGTPYGVNVVPWLTLLTSAVQQIAARLDALDKGKP